MSARALVLLLWLRLRGNLRQRVEELSGWRGLVSVGSIVLFTLGLVYVLGDQLDASIVTRLTNDRLTLAGALPVGVLVAVLSTVLFSSGPALHFGNSEVNLLWTAPVTRLWLILYKLFSYSAGAIVTALLLVVVLPGDSGTRLIRFFALFLTLVFIQLCSTVLRMAISSISHHHGSIFNKARSIKLMLLTLTTVTLLLLLRTIFQEPNNAGLLSAAGSTLLDTLMLPFSTVSNLILYKQFSRDFMTDSITVCTMIALCIAAIVRLDKLLDQHMLDESTQASLRWTRALQSGILSERSYTVNSSSRPVVRMGGLGPILWSRWLYSLRSSGHTVLALIVVAGLTGLVAGTQTDNIPVTYLSAAAFFASLYFLPRVLVFDFRGAPQLMETLHGLPISPSTLCLAQISTSVIWKTIIEMTAVTGLLITSAQMTPTLWIIAFCVLPLINFLLVGVDNLFFILHPNRLLPVGRLDFDFLGRTLFEFLGKSVILVIVLAMAFFIASWMAKLFPGSLMLFVVVFLVTLFLACVVILLSLAFAYTQADVSKFDDL